MGVCPMDFYFDKKSHYGAEENFFIEGFLMATHMRLACSDVVYSGHTTTQLTLLLLIFIDSLDRSLFEGRALKKTLKGGFFRGFLRK